jgi:hypothetical protein
MAENPVSGNNKKTWNFLKELKGESPVNIVAIEPESLDVTGITRPAGDEAILQFIEKHNGTHNLYFTVNTPYANAPDNKLKKDHIEFINAVWLDADPRKDFDFKAERKRLFTFANDLRESDNPPTFIIDSGGGIQAFWMLARPVKVTDDSRALYEAYSRRLADEHDTDRVQNIDRLMRLPFTWNIPTDKKAAAGRTRTLSRLAKTGDYYDA